MNSTTCTSTLEYKGESICPKACSKGTWHRADFKVELSSVDWINAPKPPPRSLSTLGKPLTLKINPSSFWEAFAVWKGTAGWDRKRVLQSRKTGNIGSVWVDLLSPDPQSCDNGIKLNNCVKNVSLLLLASVVPPILLLSLLLLV